MNGTPVVQKSAWRIAFVLAGLSALGAIFGSLITLPLALVPLFAGIGIRRKRVWSAWGFALYLLSQLLLLPLVVSREGTNWLALVPMAAFSVILAAFYFEAGRSLSQTGAARGNPLPWVLLALVISVPLYFVRPFVIPTGAMENTLLTGDRLLAQTFPKPNPQRGELIVFSYPVDHKQTFVKRIVGVPGDRIRIVGKQLYRNGAQLTEPWAKHATDYLDSYRDNFPSEPNVPVFPQAQAMLEQNVLNGEVVVPKNKYFVLGDNRDMSLDSRYWGLVDASEIIGKPFLIYDSAEQSSENALSRKHTRWNRIFLPL